MDRKYVVVKAEDWNRLRKVTESDRDEESVERVVGATIMLNNLEALALDDAEVIRGQDLTAASIFYHYASSLQSMAEMIDGFNGSYELLADDVQISVDTSHLRKVADYFFDAAHRSEQRTDRKLPD